MSPENSTSPEGITYETLLRFEETLKPPFRRAFESGRVDLLPLPSLDPDSDDPLARAAAKGRAVFDEKNGRLVVPLWLEGKPLGLLVVWGVSAERLTPAVSPFLSALVEAGLEMARLRLAAETDGLTGLANEAALDNALVGALSRLTPSKVRGRPALDRQGGGQGLSILALEPEGLGGLVDRFGRRFADRLLKEVARRVRELGPPVLCAARAGYCFLLLLEGGAAVVRELAARLRREVKSLELAPAEGPPWPGGLRMGASTVDAQSWEGGALAVEAAAAFKARAQRALGCSGRVGLEEVLFFSEIVDKAGRLTELLPLNRLRLNLGRLHGLGDGERFQVMGVEQDGGGRDAPKAEIMVVSVGEEESVAEVVSLDDPTWNLRPGDRLRRLGHEAGSQAEAGLEMVVSLSGRELKVILDEVTGLACHRSFMTLFNALGAGQEPFSAVLVRLEGLEGIREVCGRVGADSLMAALAAVGREVLPAPELLGRFAPDTLAALLPGVEAEAARDLAAEVLARLSRKLERGLRAGVSFHPCPGFTAADALDNAAKALVHAGFLEPGVVVIFDAVSLNISGDALFNQGRLSEAVAEYERALLLSPAEPNVLNSLGVCYGHLGQTDKAMSHFERALAAAPHDYMAHYNLGYALMGQGRLAEARQRLEESLDLDPEHADTLFQLGRLAQGEGRLAQAQDLLARAAQRPDCRRAVFRHLGEVMAASGRFAEAEDAFKQAVKANPHDASALSSLAGLYLERGANLEIALSLARRAGELEPQAPRHLRVTAQALVSLGKLEEAAETLRQAQAAHPQDPFLALQMGKVEAARGQKAAARDEFWRALALEPNLQAAKEGLAALEMD